MSSEAVYFRTIPLILVGLVLPGFLDEYNDVTQAYGTMAGQAMAAAAWLALGPASLVWRLPVSISWPLLSYFVSREFIRQGEFAGEHDLGLFLIVLWIATFLLVGWLQWATGWRLRFAASTAPAEQRLDWQFTTRELLVITAVVAGLLGVGRQVLPEFLRTTWLSGTWGYWTFWLVSQLSFGVPLLCVALRPQSRWKVIAVGLLLASLVALIVDRYCGNWFPFWHLGHVAFPPTIVSVIWVTLFGIAIRTSGYQLVRCNEGGKN